MLTGSMDDCVFCSESLGNGKRTTKLGAKGWDGISKANDLRQADISVAPGQIVHTKCRKDFCSQLSIERDIRKRRYDCTGGSSGMHCACASICQFCVSLSEHCLFCGTPDKYQGKQKTHKLLPVCTCTLCTPCCPTWQLQATICTSNLFTSTSSDWLNCLFGIPKSTISSRMDIT